VERYILEYTPVVKSIALGMVRKLPACVEVDDLVQVGMIGLLDAIKRHDHENRQSFRGYACIRIKGAMIDELRRCDHLSRQHRRSAKNGDDCEAFNVSLDDLMEDGFDIGLDDDPLSLLIKKERVVNAVDFFDGLDETHKKIMHMYYQDDIELVEISRSMGKSDRWAERILWSILKLLKEHLIHQTTI
jgi:RNA polymerase sigma factor for flagellar operon FliA